MDTGKTLRGSANLAFDATDAVTHIVEGMYRNIAAHAWPLGDAPEGPAPGIAGFVHESVRRVNKATRHTSDWFLQHIAPTLDRAWPPGPYREAAIAALNGVCKPVKGSRVHVVGVAYKRDIADVRESPAIDILGLLIRLGAVVSYSDSFVPKLELESRVLTETPLEKGVSEADCVVIVTDHSGIDYPALAERAALVVDSRNALRGIASSKIVRL